MESKASPHPLHLKGRAFFKDIQEKAVRGSIYDLDELANAVPDNWCV
jgi:hypothetical protein